MATQNPEAIVPISKMGTFGTNRIEVKTLVAANSQTVTSKLGNVRAAIAIGAKNAFSGIGHFNMGSFGPWQNPSTADLPPKDCPTTATVTNVAIQTAIDSWNTAANRYTGTPYTYSMVLFLGR